MSAEKIIDSWKKRSFKPVYWLEGEENYYIDILVNYAEHHILNESEAGFNLTVFYGRDAQWPEVINACMRYPMFADYQVVLLKEAQHMKDIEKLEAYIQQPLSSTVFIISYKEKKLDGRGKLSKILKQRAEIFTTKKLYDSELPKWCDQLINSKGYTIQPKALILMVDHIGNDLNRINNEIEKLLINLGNRKVITEDDIEKYIGISKEYNAFELQNAVAQKNLAKAMRIIQYYESNPKVAPIQLVLPSIYSFFSKLLVVHKLPQKSESAVQSAVHSNYFVTKDLLSAVNNYDYQSVEKVILILNDYNLKSLGVNMVATPDGALLKEMTVKMIGV